MIGAKKKSKNVAKKRQGGGFSRELVKKEKPREDEEEDQFYAKVIKIGGSGIFHIMLEDGTESIGVMRGKMRKRQWINKDCIVLVSRRDYQKDRHDILIVYDDSEVRQLKRENELVDKFAVQSQKVATTTDVDDYFTFGSEEPVKEKKVITSYADIYVSSDSEEETPHDNHEFKIDDNDDFNIDDI